MCEVNLDFAINAIGQAIAAAVVKALREDGLSYTATSAPQHQEKEPQGAEWGTREDACRILHCSLPTVHAYMRQSVIAFTKVGRKTLIDLQDLRKKLEAGELAKYSRR